MQFEFFIWRYLLTLTKNKKKKTLFEHVFHCMIHTKLCLHSIQLYPSVEWSLHLTIHQLSSVQYNSQSSQLHAIFFFAFEQTQFYAPLLSRHNHQKVIFLTLKFFFQTIKMYEWVNEWMTTIHLNDSLSLLDFIVFVHFIVKIYLWVCVLMWIAVIILLLLLLLSL